MPWAICHDPVGMEPILKGIDFAALLADKAFYSDALQLNLDQHGGLAVIPPKAGRKVQTRCDCALYKRPVTAALLSCDEVAEAGDLKAHFKVLSTVCPQAAEFFSSSPRNLLRPKGQGVVGRRRQCAIMIP
jgi:hypothetical protein